jgi:hypothetical protein
MLTLPPSDRLAVLRFAASFLWADLEVVPAEHTFLLSLARELGSEERELDEDVGALLRAPPALDTIDPTQVSPDLAGAIRDAALRAIACDGRVDPGEMELFELLDDLLPGRADPRLDERP